MAVGSHPLLQGRDHKSDVHSVGYLSELLFFFGIIANGKLLVNAHFLQRLTQSATMKGIKD